MSKRKHRGRKVNPVIVILVILLALLLIFSRSRRATRRVGPSPVRTTAQLAAQTPQTSNPAETMEISPIPTTITVSLLLGKLEPAKDDNYLVVPQQYASRSGMYMHRQALEAFLEMHAAAKSEGVNLTILSAMRTFDHQKRIWNGKWNGNTILHGSILATDIQDPVDRALEILRFSAMPGTSRHHWGTDIDLNSLQNSYFHSGEGKRVYEWLTANADRFGFFQPYTANGRQGGYEEEKWHWSYYPLSKAYLEAYPSLIGYNDITGFDGWETARKVDVIRNYVLTIADRD